MVYITVGEQDIAFTVVFIVRSTCDAANSQGWISYFGQALRTSASYLPSQMSEVLTQTRDYAVAKLPVSGVKSVCAITV